MCSSVLSYLVFLMPICHLLFTHLQLLLVLYIFKLEIGIIFDIFTLYKGKCKKYCRPLMENSMTQLRSVTCHMGSQCYLLPDTSERTLPSRLHSSQTGWYSIYRPFKDGGLSKPRPRVQRATGPRLLLDSPRPARHEPTT